MLLKKKKKNSQILGEIEFFLYCFYSCDTYLRLYDMVLNYTSYDHNESTRVQLPEAAGILMGVWVYMDLVLPEEPGLSHLKD